MRGPERFSETWFGAGDGLGDRFGSDEWVKMPGSQRRGSLTSLCASLSSVELTLNDAYRQTPGRVAAHAEHSVLGKYYLY